VQVHDERLFLDITPATTGKEVRLSLELLGRQGKLPAGNVPDGSVLKFEISGDKDRWPEVFRWHHNVWSFKGNVFLTRTGYF
jgi:hypothetical protein